MGEDWRGLLAAATRALTEAGVSSPRVDAELLAAHVADVPRGRLPIADDPSVEEADAFRRLVTRRATREPLQYIVGTAPFWRGELAVGPGVFVPRFETELLVEWALEALRPLAEPVVADLCSGSGAIARAVAAERPDATVYAVERYPRALEWLRRNTHGTSVIVVDGDATDPATLSDLDGACHAVLSNPPYVPRRTAVEPEVDADPDTAVYGGDDGLDVIRPLIDRAAALARGGGVVAIEHDDTHGEAVPALLRERGFTAAVDHRDLSGRPRFSTARRPLALCHVRLYDCRKATERDSAIDAAVSAVKAGDLVVLPTDTLYGLGADAFKSWAIEALLRTKGRGRDMAPPVLVGSRRALDGLTMSIPEPVKDLVAAYWPGPLTVVIDYSPTLDWDLGDTGGTVAVRMPLHPVALEVLRETGPMAVSSANKTGQPAAGTAAEAKEQLGYSVEVYLEAGPLPDNAPSTIVDCTDGVPRVLREGALSLEQIRRIAPDTAGPDD
ncbi:MAG TPA: peptide chain release factor N(5)-glutamine methyltransferase [Stackebrandtia sp.]|nr:peptide chain release factor N(5)-glutamine methyltransferase [Stackebrandtia sp.]HZE39198.1 peptide chain release factor N(5)-glutamine methyltransferase [Stackebrandtia sp.]